jgi:hypothetical protein
MNALPDAKRHSEDQMTQDHSEAKRSAVDTELSAWLRAEVRRELGQARRRDRRLMAGLALGAMLSVPLAGLALPERNTFAAGERILASEINDNFEHLWDAVTNLEGAAETFVARSDADERYAPRSVAPIGNGFFDPLVADAEVALPADAFTTVQSQSIEVPGPGRVVVIATAALASTSTAGAPLVWFGVEGDGESENAVSTYAAMPGGVAQSLTVHGVFRVTDPGVKLYSAGALPPGAAAVSRSSHMTLLFIAD